MEPLDNLKKPEVIALERLAQLVKGGESLYNAKVNLRGALAFLLEAYPECDERYQAVDKDIDRTTSYQESYPLKEQRDNLGSLIKKCETLIPEILRGLDLKLEMPGEKDENGKSAVSYYLEIMLKVNNTSLLLSSGVLSKEIVRGYGSEKPVP